MAQASKGKLNYRCPSCFIRDLDIDLFYDEEKKEYYCLRCCFHANEKRVLELNQMCRFRYGLIDKRVVDFNADNNELVFKTHKKGEM